MKQLHLLLSLFIISSSFQGFCQNHTYTFEDDQSNWVSEDKQWFYNDAQASNGAYSLAYTVKENSKLPLTNIMSINTKHHTIIKVRTAVKGEQQIIIGSDYEGVVLGIEYSGAILWKAKTAHGTMNHDVWCADLNGDDNDEVLVANANGYLYCFDINGKKLWEFKPYDGPHLTPMYAVTVVKDTDKTPYVVCGDFSSNIYYLTGDGNLVKTIDSKEYSKVKGWGDTRPEDYKSNPNFLRPIPQNDGSDLLIMHATNNHMQSDGDIIVMKPLQNTALCYISDVKAKSPVGDVRVMDKNGDGHYDVLYGSSSLNGHKICKIEFNDSYTSATVIDAGISYKNTGVTSYRVNQPVILANSTENEYSILSSNQMLTYAVTDTFTLREQVSTIFAYNDAWQGENGKLILASCQDGGSCVHVIDTNTDNWKEEYKNLIPTGKISRMLFNADKVRNDLASFVKPDWQREPRLVTGFEGRDLPIAEKINGSTSLELLASPWNKGKNQEPSWRSPLYDGNIYQDTRDKRNDYILSEQQVFDHFTPDYAGAPGLSTWGGHGNDPLYFSLKVLKDIADFGYADGQKQTIYIYPEMNHHGEEFDFVMDHQIFPLMNHLRTIGGHMAFRAKDTFWQGHIYTETWKNIISGKYADAAIPMLEETTDKTQDLSILGRMGLWAAGSVDSWGVRCSRDDPSFDRSRQFSSQKLSNHFLRKTIYSLACGATYIHNSYPDTENSKLNYHSSLVLELLAKEALFVPERNEIISLSPVHMSIISPQERYLNEASNNKWTTYFDKTTEDNNPMVFSHMNGSWLGATLTPWDFSSYANGTIDRRQNAVPHYPFGQVLITPVQNGTLADMDAPRGKMVDKLHPIYKDIMKEYITDGVDYIAADNSNRYKADDESFYTQIKKDIEDGAKKLPVNVSGDKVAWVVAQVSETHLRLTLVDGPWLSPDDRKVTVSFNNINPVKVTDILSKEEYSLNGGSSVEIDVPCGMFRFVDIELKEGLK